MAFLINPFLFFYYEEKEEGEKISKVCENKIHLNFFKNKTFLFAENMCSIEMDSGIIDFSYCSYHTWV